MVTVPSQYQQYVNQAAQGTGLPVNVVAAQASMESGFNPNAVSPTDAEGFWQFEPATYNAIAPSIGVPTNSEFNITDETQAYTTYMNQLLSEEGGSVFKALEAYNAGPGDLAAGQTYATNILSNAGQSTSLTDQSASVTSFNPLSVLPPFFGLLPGSGGSSSTVSGITGDVVGSIGDSILKSLGLTSTKDLFERLGLILLGAALILVGLNMTTKISYGGVAAKLAPPAVKA